MEKILLVLLPFWDPQIPPSGISCLKSFLQRHGFNVKAVNANTEAPLNEIYHNYFDLLKEFVPEERMGNFYKVGYDVLRHQSMAFINYKDRREYIDLIKSVIYNTFYIQVDDDCILKLDKITAQFYSRLERYVLALLEEEMPSVLGISVYGGTLPASVFAFRLCKEKYPHIKTVMGGGVFADLLAVGSPNMDYFLENTPYIDHIIVGEGELLFLKLLQGKPGKSQKLFTLEDSGGEILDLSSAALPDFSDFQLQYYPSLFAYTSRSCPFQCRFCTETVQWGRYRKKSAAQVVEELEKLYETYGFQLFMMGDSLLNPMAADLADGLVKAGASIYWDGYFRVDKHACDKENTMLWRRGGFYRARLGVESGSPRVLESMHKEITVEQTAAALSGLADAGIKTTTYWVVGYPGETEEDFQKTLDLIEEMADDIYEADCSPFWYFVTGQVGDDKWRDQSTLLYPANTREMMMQQTWIVRGEPRREEIYRRMWRFVEHCKKLGIPNPYTLKDIYKADERWRELHKNAVPPMVDFKNRDAYIDENKNIKELLAAAGTERDEGDFSF